MEESQVVNNGNKLSDLADVLMNFKKIKADAEATLSEANRHIEETEAAILVKMQEDEIEKFAHAGRLFFPRVESHPSINKELEPAFFAWLEQHGERGIVKETIHPSTLKSWYKENSERFAEELSEKQFLKVFEKIRISDRKA